MKIEMSADADGRKFCFATVGRGLAPAAENGTFSDFPEENNPTSCACGTSFCDAK